MTVQPLTRPTFFNPRVLWGFIFLGAVALSFYQAGIFGQDIFNPGGWPLFWRFLSASVHPDFSPEMLLLTFQATLTTLAYAVCGTFLSVLLGLVGGLLSSEVWWSAVFPRQNKQRTVWLAARAILAGPRAIHEMVWGLFFVNLWGLDALTAILAIAIPFGAVTAKVFSEILDETPRQSLQALVNSGVKPLTAFAYSLLPQAFLNLLSYVFYRFECSIRSAAVLGIIGAGGLGYQILLSLQSLRYSQLWTFFLALFLLNGLVDLSSALLRRRLGCASRLDLNQYKRGQKPRQSKQPVYPRDVLVNGIGFWVLLSVPLCFWYVRPDLTKLWSPRTGEFFGALAKGAFSPHVDSSQLQQLLSLSAETLSISILAITLAGIGGLLLSFPGAYNFFLPGGLLNPSTQDARSNSWGWATLLFTRAVLLIFRAIPPPIWALVFLFVIFPGILPGALALGLHNLGILGRLMAEGVENLDERPLQALKAQGAPASSVFLYGVLPLTMPRSLAYILYRWEVCIRETVVVGLVGAGGLGHLLTEQMSSFDTQGIVATLGCLIILTFLVDWVSSLARKSLR
ncbi:MAG: ABC transporter permease subunit [Gloeobacterales cyanobacterium]